MYKNPYTIFSVILVYFIYTRFIVFAYLLCQAQLFYSFSFSSIRLSSDRKSNRYKFFSAAIDAKYASTGSLSELAMGITLGLILVFDFECN